ncbi:cytochrome P450 family protein [Tieghemostelium lacteum]|uniref:Cytochrome P450 family protein n=1 Tax=Tieghemostelium lacteum TaxID=361077 RepID=A0A151ZJE7_TIELA|nr:cytochrome P450 family protein [Tieghemostelium lacteum]|eukprot:KYQ94047.1 cytochrome P450 family protein [Tieghemostelium lacteum]
MFISLILLIIFLIFFISLKKNNKCSILPPGPKAIPFFGNLIQIGTQPHLSIQKLSKIYGGAMSLWFGKVHTVILSSPQYIKEVIVNQSQYSTDRYLMETALIIGENIDILFSNGEYWKKYRLLLLSSMSKLKSHIVLNETISNEAYRLSQCFIELQERVSGDIIIDPIQYFKNFTLNVIMLILYSDRSDYHQDGSQNIVIDAVNYVEKELSVGNMADLFPILKPFFKNSRNNLKSALGRVWDFSEKSIECHRKALLETGKIKDMMDIMLSEIDKMPSDQASFYNNEGLVKVCSDLLISGTETSASTMSWLLVFLVNNPNIQQKIRAELRQVLQDEGMVVADRLEISHRSKTLFFNACIKEVLRIRPVGALALPRVMNHDVTVGDYIIPKGSQVLMNVYGLAMDDTLWVNPEEFNPYRWLNELDTVSQYSDYKNITFGVGSRSCIGSTLAKDEIFLGVGNMILNYNIESINQKPLDEKGHFGIALSPNSYKIKLTKLNI